jgi:hypothetical protein
VQQAALQTGGKLEETSFLTPLLQGGLRMPLLSGAHTLRQRERHFALCICALQLSTANQSTGSQFSSFETSTFEPEVADCAGAAAVGSVPAAEDVLRGRLRAPARTLFEALRGYPGNRGEADGAVSTAACLVTAGSVY